MIVGEGTVAAAGSTGDRLAISRYQDNVESCRTDPESSALDKDHVLYYQYIKLKSITVITKEA